MRDHSKNHPVTATYIGSDTVTGCSYTTLSDSTPAVESHRCRDFRGNPDCPPTPGVETLSNVMHPPQRLTRKKGCHYFSRKDTYDATHLSLAAVLAIALTTAACGNDDTETGAAAAPASTSATATPSPSPSESMAGSDIVDTAVAAGDFTTLAAALEAANLVETLEEGGPFTVFAPTDAAFAKLPARNSRHTPEGPQG